MKSAKLKFLTKKTGHRDEYWAMSPVETSKRSFAIYVASFCFLGVVGLSGVAWVQEKTIKQLRSDKEASDYANYVMCDQAKAIWMKVEGSKKGFGPPHVASKRKPATPGAFAAPMPKRTIRLSLHKFRPARVLIPPFHLIPVE